VGPADADVVESAAQAQGGAAVLIDAVGADPVVGVGGAVGAGGGLEASGVAVAVMTSRAFDMVGSRPAVRHVPRHRSGMS
jgi:hypothetical protein